MKTKNRNTIALGIILIIITILVSINSCTSLGNKFSALHRNGFFIPDESNASKFKETKTSAGSGEYWLYGEDDQYYYSTFLQDEYKSYIKIAREKANTIQDFDKHNYLTWDKSYALAGDLLEKFAQKPEKLEFVKCEVVHGQTILQATYQVPGKDSKEVEDFLIEHYGMGELKWVCCGWENKNGNRGSFGHEELNKIDSYCSGSVLMYASGDEKERLEFDRNKIEYFTVLVEIMIV